MNTLDARTAWIEYCKKELGAVQPLFAKHKITLNDEQPHVGGEKYLMQAVTTVSGKKLVLLGTYQGEKVVIKVTSDPHGIAEIAHERVCRKVLNHIKFSHDTFLSPKELLFRKENGYVISVQTFITNDTSFLDRSTEEQFAFALTAFKAQESTHATTYEHEKRIVRTFGKFTAQNYLEQFNMFQKTILDAEFDTKHKALLEAGAVFLKEHQEVIDQYGNFLTHTDFVPHNFRIQDEQMYLLDHSSLRFGNKYEGWARFMNFMSLYNPELEEALLFYVKENRTKEEIQSLKAMRIYRLGEIIAHYINTLSKSTGPLLELNQARVIFWTEILVAILTKTPLKEEVRTQYQNTRDKLRSEDELVRQKELY